MGLRVGSSRSVDSETAGIVEDAWSKMTPHWQALVPDMDVVIEARPLNQVPALKKLVADIRRQVRNGQDARDFWVGRQVVCYTPRGKASTIYARLDRQTVWHDPPYYFQKELYGVIAKILWGESDALRTKGIAEATGLAATRPDLAYIGFRDSFSRFFLNPEWLRERRPDAWNLMQKLDRFVAGGCR